MADDNVLVADNPYTLGRGKMLIQKDTDPAGEWLDFAHVLEVNVTINTETLEHKSSRSGLKIRDKIITTELTASGTLIVDVPIIENIKLFFMGDGFTDVSQTGTTLTDETIVVHHNRWSEISKRALSAVVVTGPVGTPVYVIDTDYILDAENGLIAPLTTGSIADGGTIEVDATVAAETILKVSGGVVPDQRRHVWFIGDAAAGIDQQIKGFVNLIPSGDLSMIGEDWQQFTLGLEFELHSRYSSIIEYYDLGKVA